MTSSPTAQPSALGLVILAWLFTRPKGKGTRSQLEKAVLPFVTNGASDADRVARLEREIEALAGAALVTRTARGTVTIGTAGRETVTRWVNGEPSIPPVASVRSAPPATISSAPPSHVSVPPSIRSSPPSVPSGAARAELEGFAKRVIAAARASKTGRYGHNKVFISHVWRGLEGEGESDPQAFKERLVAAHREGLLDLSRADLVEAMPAEDVAASEVSYYGATFHFVRMDSP